MIIGIDMGKANIKAYNGEKTFICPSTFAEGVDKLDTGHQIIFNGRKYLIGDPTLTYDFDVTKEKLSHKLMMYLAISQFVKNDERVTIITNCPIDIWLNKQLKRSFKKYLNNDCNDGCGIEITVGLTTKRFYIDEVVIVAESSGLCYSYPQKFSTKIVGVVDIGGGQRNHGLYDDFNIIRDQSFCESDGLHFLRKAIRDALKKMGVMLSDNEVKYVLDNSEYEHKFTVDKLINSYLNKISDDCKSRKWGDTIDLIFTGGGSVALKEKISEKFPNSTISEDALFDNCKGNYRMGVLLCEKRRN